MPSSSFWQIFVLFLFAGLFGAGLYGSLHVKDGLDLSDVLPRSSQEHKFVEKQSKYFSFYRMVGATMENFDYAHGQKILYKYHEAFKRVGLKSMFIISIQVNPSLRLKFT